jgi:hypothetical protein
MCVDCGAVLYRLVGLNCGTALTCVVYDRVVDSPSYNDHDYQNEADHKHDPCAWRHRLVQPKVCIGLLRREDDP